MDKGSLNYGKPHQSSDKFANLLVKTFGYNFSTRKIREISDRIETLKNIYGDASDRTHQAFGVIYFKSSLAAVKIDGKLISKDDFRLDEVNLKGDRAKPNSYEIPLHFLRLQTIEELDIVKKGLITVGTINQVLNSEKVFLTCGSDMQKLCQDTIQVLVGPKRKVNLEQGKLWVEDSDCLNMPWMWSKRFVNFTVSQAHFKGFFDGQNYNWTHVEPRARHTFTFAQAERVQPDVISQRFSAADYRFSNVRLQRDVYRGHIFRFAVRDVRNKNHEITEMMKNFERKGYINYFNLNDSDLGHKSLIIIGKSLVTEKLAKTIEWLLRPFAQTRDFSLESLKALYFVFRDRKVLRTISCKNKNYLQPIFEGMPTPSNLCYRTASEILRNPVMQCLSEYTDLFLNYVWNETVNIMVRRRGLKLAVGDLVFCSPEDEQRVLYEKKFGATVGKHALGFEENINLKEAVRPLTQAEIDSRKYTIFDMVIPVCGACVVWPKNDIGNYIDEALKPHGIHDKRFFQQPSRVCLPFVYLGTYRKVFCKPEQLKWWIKDYDHDNAPLVLDDIAVEKKKAEEELLDDVEEDGEIVEIKKALVVEFFVPKTTHLMTPLRELFKKNNFGELNTAYGETFGAKPEQIKKLLNSLDEYKTIMLMNAPDSTVERPSALTRVELAHQKNTMKRIEILERELAALRKERKLNEPGKEVANKKPEETCAVCSKNNKTQSNCQPEPQQSVIDLCSPANNLGLIAPFYHDPSRIRPYVYENMDCTAPPSSDFYFVDDDEPQPKRPRLDLDGQPDDDFYDPFEVSKETQNVVESDEENFVSDVGFSPSPSSSSFCSNDLAETNNNKTC